MIDENTWRCAYEDCKQFFEDGEMLGWFVAHPGVPADAGAVYSKASQEIFSKEKHGVYHEGSGGEGRDILCT